MKLIHRCLDLLYPPKCIFCDALLHEDETYFCRSCGEKVPMAEGADLCRKGTYFDKCIAPLYYQGMRPFWSLMCERSSQCWMW